MTDTLEGTDTNLQIRRILDAPRDLVYRAWTEPDRLRQWWGVAEDYSTPIAEVDLRVGGTYRLGMQAPDQTHPFVVTGIFKEVQPPEKLVYTWVWESHDTGEAPGRNEDAGAPTDAAETIVTVEFRERDGKTELVLTHEFFPDQNMRDEHGKGWEGVLNRLSWLVEERNR